MKPYFLKIVAIILLICSPQNYASSPVIAGANPLFAIPIFTVAGGEATFFGGSIFGLLAIIAKQVVSHFVAKKVVPAFLFHGNHEQNIFENDEQSKDILAHQKDPKNKGKSASAAATAATQNNRKKPSQKSSQKEVIPAQKADPVEPINELANLDDVLAKPLGRGSTGRTEAHNLHEQLAMKEVMSNPLDPNNSLALDGIPMNDYRWPKDDSWKKMTYNVDPKNTKKIEIHYVWNSVTGLFDDFKFKIK